MGLLDKLLRRNTSNSVVEAPPCPHIVLSARWDSVEDMGDDSKAVGYECICGNSYDPEEGRTMRESARERLQETYASRGGSQDAPE